MFERGDLVKSDIGLYLIDRTYSNYYVVRDLTDFIPESITLPKSTNLKLVTTILRGTIKDDSHINHHIIDYQESFEAFKEYISNAQFDKLVVDTETDNKIVNKAVLWGIGLCFDEEQAFYIPFKNNRRENLWSEDKEKEIKEFLINLLKSKQLIGHNIIYDILVLYYNWGVDFTDQIYSDTILQKHLLDEERPHGLKETAVKYLGPWANKAQNLLYQNIEFNGGKTNKDNVEMWKADTDILAEYCCFDVHLTLKLFNLFEPKLKQEGLSQLFYDDEIMPLYKWVTIPMKKQGFPIDVPYFQSLLSDVNKELITLEDELQELIRADVKKFVEDLLNEDYPIKPTGSFPKYAAEVVGLPLPVGKTGKVTLAKKAIDSMPEPQEERKKNVYMWLRGAAQIDKEIAKQAQFLWWSEKNTEKRYVFNLSSNDHLKWLFFEEFCEQPLSYTEGGEPQVDEDFLDTVKANYSWVQKLIDYKKLMKLKSTYIEGILEQQIDGVIYTDMLQFGTTSGRYASRSPNLQNLPSVKEEDSGLTELVLKYVNSIRRGFIAPKGYKLVDADQSALEPRCFATMSNDKNLQKIFFDNEDMYASIAIRSFKVTDASPFKKDINFLGKLYPDLRKKVKAYALAACYGAEAYRISELLGVTVDEAQSLLDSYFEAYPGLINYIKNCHKSACINGYVKTIYGRIRHLPRVKELYKIHGNKLLDHRYVKKYKLQKERREFKNGLNNSTNFPIQGLAAHIMNRSAINIAKEYKKRSINGYVALQIHDQLISLVKDEQAEEAKQITQYQMENSVKISVPLIAEPQIAENMKDSH